MLYTKTQKMKLSLVMSFCETVRAEPYFLFKGGKNFDRAGIYYVRIHGPTVCQGVQRANNNTE